MKLKSDMTHNSFQKEVDINKNKFGNFQMTSLTVFQQSDFSEPESSNLLGKGGYGSVYKLQQKLLRSENFGS